MIGPSFIALVFGVEDVDKEYEMLTKKGVKFEWEPRDEPWGARF